MAACSKFQDDLVLDAALDYISTATMCTVCSDQPATYSEATATYDLVTHVMSSGDFSKDDGSPSGREVNIASQASITSDHSGTATGIFLGITTGAKRVFITTCTSQAITAPNPVTIPAWIITLLDVTA